MGKSQIYLALSHGSDRLNASTERTASRTNAQYFVCVCFVLFCALHFTSTNKIDFNLFHVIGHSINTCILRSSECIHYNDKYHVFAFAFGSIVLNICLLIWLAMPQPLLLLPLLLVLVCVHLQCCCFAFAMRNYILVI